MTNIVARLRSEANMWVAEPQATGEPHGGRREMTDNERKVLKALNYNEDGTCFSGFAFLQDETGLDRKAVRRACRSLKRKGLAQFATGLWTEDGEPRGSGYAATKEGAALSEYNPDD